MCLITKATEPSISEEIIPCYKVLVKNPILGEWITPYVGFKINSVEIIAKGEEEVYIDPLVKKYTLIGSGFIHAFLDFNSAAELANQTHGKVFVAYIPKGVKYFESLGKDEICAKVIILTHL